MYSFQNIFFFRVFKIDFVNPTAKMILQLVLLQPEKFKQGFPPKVICCKLFTVEADLNEIICDDNGADMNTESVKSYYHVTFQSETTPSAKHANFDDKSYFLQQMESRSYINMTVLNDEAYLIECIYGENKNENDI